MTWGHSTSKDLIHWNYEGEAIERDAFGTIFSGSSVVDTSNTAGFGKGAIISYYTSAGQSQTQSMAYSTDNGKTFTKYAANPVLTSEIPDFRDPNIIWHEATKRWILILAEKTHVKFYSSTDLKNWTFESNFGEEYGNHDGVWECPDIFEINGKWFILLNINPGGPFGGSATQYFVGDFDGHKFTCEDEPTETKWLDYGRDHYATVSFNNAPDGRIVVIPWMSNWQYAAQVPTKQYRSANGIPRDLSSFDYKGETYLSVKPSKEVYAAFSKKATGHLSNACRVDVQLKGNATITLSNSKGEQVVISYNAKNEKISMDRTKSGEVGFSAEFPVVTTSPTYGKIKTLQIFIDSSAEGQVIEFRAEHGFVVHRRDNVGICICNPDRSITVDTRSCRHIKALLAVDDCVIMDFYKLTGLVLLPLFNHSGSAVRFITDDKIKGGKPLLLRVRYDLN